MHYGIYGMGVKNGMHYGIYGMGWSIPYVEQCVCIRLKWDYLWDLWDFFYFWSQVCFYFDRALFTQILSTEHNVY